MKTIVGYADRLSAAPGETLSFKVSCESGAERYSAKLVRLLCTDDSPLGPGLTEIAVASDANGDYPARRQETQIGSYAEAEMGEAIALSDFTLQAIVWPTVPAGGVQAILSFAEASGEAHFTLGLDASGELSLWSRDGTLLSLPGQPLRRRWLLVAASFEAASRTLSLHRIALETPYAGIEESGRADAVLVAAITPRCATVTFAAELTPQGPRQHFNGKIERPRVYRRALDREEIIAASAHGVPAEPGLIGAWDFSRELTSQRIVDVSDAERHGTLVNLPARAVTGAGWTGECHDWKVRPDHYAAIHFHEDDLFDCCWETDFTLTIPADLRSGVYAMKLDDGGRSDHVVFFVHPPRGTSTARIAYLAPTCTYLAYGNYRELEPGPLTEATQGALPVFGWDDLYLNRHPELGDSLYSTHSDGSGVCYSSRTRPLLNMRPNTFLWCFNGDGFLTAWLDAMGHDVDVITDEDLHEEGQALLDRYRVVITGGHPEYTSTRMWDALKGYCREGGRLMYLGGNGFYWRIGFIPGANGAIEVRRAEDGARAWVAEPGEYYMSSTGEYGGMWRRAGRPPNTLVGVGFVAQGFDSGSYYRRTAASRDPRAAFIFDGVGDERIGDFGIAGGGAAGQEIDATNQSLGTPPGTLIIAVSENHSASMLVTKEEFRSTPLFVDATTNEVARAEIAFFTTGGGGAVFSPGSISWTASLPVDGYDNNVSRITRNVLERFLDPSPFAD